MESVTADFASLLTDPKYSDLEIRCEDRKFPVHRAIVCCTSIVLARECDGGFMEAGTRVIKHSLFDASTVQRMIQFMYTAAYTLDFVDTPKLCNESGPDDIQAKKAKRLAEVDRCGHPTPVLYNDKATTPPPTGLAMSAESWKAIAHVSVWAIADYHDVQKLKPLALRNFGTCKVSSPREFAAVTTVVYTNTNARDDDLRKTVIRRTLDEKQGLLGNEAFMSAVAEQAELQPFAAELLSQYFKEASSVQSQQQRRYDRRRSELADAEDEIARLKDEIATMQRSIKTKDKALQATVDLTGDCAECRNCGLSFGGYLEDGLLRCRSCRCRHFPK